MCAPRECLRRATCDVPTGGSVLWCVRPCELWNHFYFYFFLQKNHFGAGLSSRSTMMLCSAVDSRECRVDSAYSRRHTINNMQERTTSCVLLIFFFFYAFISAMRQQWKRFTMIIRRNGTQCAQCEWPHKVMECLAGPISTENSIQTSWFVDWFIVGVLSWVCRARIISYHHFGSTICQLVRHRFHWIKFASQWRRTSCSALCSAGNWGILKATRRLAANKKWNQINSKSSGTTKETVTQAIRIVISLISIVCSASAI